MGDSEHIEANGASAVAGGVGVLRVSLITEGTYPFHEGGVSVWCDQLVRGLGRHDFQIDAITTTGAEATSWDLPANVVSIRSVPLWGSVEPVRFDGGLDPGLRRIIGALMADITSPERATGFCERLQQLLPVAQAGRLRQALLNDDAIDLALGALGRRTLTRRTVGAGPPAPTVGDAVASLKLLEHLLRPLSAQPPIVDLCHAASNGVGVLLAMAAKWTRGTPFLLTEHGLYLRERYIAYGPETMPYHQRVFALGFFKQLTAAAYQVADVIAPGSVYNGCWERANGAAGTKIEPIYNGVDAPSFSLPAREPDAPTVTWVGRIDPLKDVKTMLRAFALISEIRPDARLRLFGGTPLGNEAYLRDCLELRNRLGLANSVCFEGRVASISDAYHAGQFVVSTSISEGFPYSVLEAMASGRAVIATDVGGVSEAVADVGLLVPPRNPRAVAEACLQLFDDPLRRQDLATRGRRRVVQLFTVGACVGRYGEIYDTLAYSASRRVRSGSMSPADGGGR